MVFALLALTGPLCRVTAESRPGIWTSSLRELTVTLAPDCPPDGYAVVQLGGYGGPGSRAVGPPNILSAARRTVTFGGQPMYRTVLWTAKSGRLYRVPVPQEARNGSEE